MAGECGFGVNAPRVVFEVFDEEVVVVNLESGHYFSLRETAADIFRLAVTGATPEVISEALATRFREEREAVRNSVRTFLDALVAEGLLVPQPETVAAPARLELPGNAGPFTPPRFEKFTDMQDLLLLDPIHDVDESGWPRAAAKDTTRGV
jgi:hypothetical protein